MNLYQIKSEHEYVQKQINNLENRISSYPDGSIYHTQNGTYDQWYLYTDSNPRKYIKKDETEIIPTMAMKKYEVLLLDELKLEEKLLSEYEKLIRSKNSESMLRMDSPYHDMLLSSYQSIDSRVASFLNQSKESNEFLTENLKFKVDSNMIVRSKSEMLIAQGLKNAHIPFLYEQTILLDNHKLSPDFTIMHPKTGAKFIWEHLGLMDNANYLDRNKEKLSIYLDNGWLPGINLILTSETSQAPFSSYIVDKTISHFFL